MKGSRGASGIPGENGEPGIPGRVGVKGDKGEVGETTCYITERGRRLQKPCPEASLYEEPASEQSGDDTGGLTYIRWGRTTCPVGGAKIVYSGKRTCPYVPLIVQFRRSLISDFSNLLLSLRSGVFC